MTVVANTGYVRFVICSEGLPARGLKRTCTHGEGKRVPQPLRMHAAPAPHPPSPLRKSVRLHLHAPGARELVGGHARISRAVQPATSCGDARGRPVLAPQQTPMATTSAPSQHGTAGGCCYCSCCCYSACGGAAAPVGTTSMPLALVVATATASASATASAAAETATRLAASLTLCYCQPPRAKEG